MPTNTKPGCPHRQPHDRPCSGPDFYPHLFDATNTDPATTVIVDDQPNQLALAAALGAATVLIAADPSDLTHPVDATIRTIDELPAAIAAL